MIYNKLMEQYFFHPLHVGELDASLPGVRGLRLGDRLQGACFQLSVLLDESGKISAARYKAYGNPYLIAGLEWICCQLEGSLKEEHPKTDAAQLVQRFEMPRSYYPTAVLIETGYRQLVNIMNSLGSCGSISGE